MKLEAFSRLLSSMMVANVIMWIHSDHPGLRAFAWLLMVAFFYVVFSKEAEHD